MRKRLSCLLGAVIIVLPVFIRPAGSLVVTCVNCGTEFTQFANNLQLVDQLARQIELVQEAIKRHETMLRNTGGLGDQNFGDALADIRQVTALLAEAKSLSIASADLDGRFAEKFKDYAGYIQDRFDAGDLAGKYQQWSEDTNSSVLTTLKAARAQSEQIEGDEAALLSELEDLATTAEGRMQALQVGNQIALAAARQTQKLRQLTLVNLQLMANFTQIEMDRRAAQDAALDTFVKTGQDTIRTGDGKGF
jgi:P-type conjugative transfer protein TrbJ